MNGREDSYVQKEINQLLQIAINWRSTNLQIKVFKLLVLC